MRRRLRHGAEVRYYHMSEENGFSPDDAIFRELADGVDLLFLANPNNPTGSRVNPELLEKIIAFCRDNGITVVLDECFIEFTDGWEVRTFFKRTGEFENLIVVRAFTKIFAIPGVRLGYLVCENKAVKERIKDQLPEWNLSVFAQRAGVAAAGEEVTAENGHVFKGGAELSRDTVRKTWDQSFSRERQIFYYCTVNFRCMRSC